MAKYFTLSEFWYSETAEREGINNFPNDEIIINNVYELMDVLDEIREDWTTECNNNNNLGSPALIITSGYRCDALNKKVGGVPSSEHRLGYAVDIVPKNGKRIRFFEFLKNWLITKNLKFSQLIKEPTWVHFSLKGKNNSQRCQILEMK